MNRLHISRRALLKATAVAGATLPLPALIGRALAKEDTVRVMGVETAALDDWTPFTEETGLKVDFVGIHADAGVYKREIVANGIGEEFDIFIANGGLEEELGPDYLHPLDESRIPNWADVTEGLKQSAILRTEDGTLYAIPTIGNADSFAYYPEDGFGAEPLSWALLFESEKTLGKVSLEDNWATTLPMAASYLIVGKGAAIADPANMNPEELKTVVDFLVERKKAGQFRALWSSFDESVDMLGRREAIVSNVWEPAVKALQGQGKAVKYADTVEGYFKWLICSYVPRQVAERGALDKAYRALGGFLGGAYSAHMATSRGYATGRPAGGVVYAEQKGLPAADIEMMKENMAKVERKYGSTYAWANIAPAHHKEIEAEWDRFRQA